MRKAELCQIATKALPMTWDDVQNLFRAVAKAIADATANKPRAPSPMLTGGDAAAALRQLQAELPAIIAYVDAHPGLLTGADDMAEALKAAGYVWAGPVENIIDATPGALATVSGWLPDVLFALGAFAPAPQPIDKPPAR